MLNIIHINKSSSGSSIIITSVKGFLRPKSLKTATLENLKSFKKFHFLYWYKQQVQENNRRKNMCMSFMVTHKRSAVVEKARRIPESTHIGEYNIYILHLFIRSYNRGQKNIPLHSSTVPARQLQWMSTDIPTEM